MFRSNKRRTIPTSGISLICGSGLGLLEWRSEEISKTPTGPLIDAASNACSWSCLSETFSSRVFTTSTSSPRAALTKAVSSPLPLASTFALFCNNSFIVGRSAFSVASINGVSPLASLDSVWAPSRRSCCAKAVFFFSTAASNCWSNAPERFARRLQAVEKRSRKAIVDGKIMRALIFDLAAIILGMKVWQSLGPERVFFFMQLAQFPGRLHGDADGRAEKRFQRIQPENLGSEYHAEIARDGMGDLLHDKFPA